MEPKNNQKNPHKRMNNAQPSFKKQSEPHSHVMEEEEETHSAANSEAHSQHSEEYEDEWEEEEVVEEENLKEQKPKIVPFLGKKSDLKENEQLEFANNAYVMFYQANTEWPCLSFDFVLDREGFSPFEFIRQPKKAEYPIDSYIVAGSQADKHENNALYLLRFADLCVSKFDDDEDLEDSFEDLDPLLLYEKVKIGSATNRIRSLHYNPIVAVMNENAQLQFVDLRDCFKSLKSKTRSDPVSNESQAKVLKQFILDQEGFGLCFSPLNFGTLACGTNAGTFYLFEPNDQSLSDLSRTRKFNAHSASIEDIAFSPSQSQVVATCSVDQTIKIFDLRAPTNSTSQKPQSTISFQAHTSDVNVISWNQKAPTLIASGAEDGGFKVWDLRKTDNSILHIKWHSEQITSIEWQPFDEWTLAVGSADNRLSIWDFSVEKDETQMVEEELKDVPQQMLFLHQGQEDLKEGKWHPVLNNVLVSTAGNGYNVFEPAIDEEPSDDEEEMILEDKNEDN